MERIAADISGAYRIGFKPLAEFSGAPKFHRVKFTVKRRGLKLHARDGYYAPPFATPPEPQTPDQSLEAALRTPFRGRSIAIKLLPVQSAVKDPKKGNWRGVLRAIASIDPSDLVYEDAAGGAKRAEVELRIAASGAGNREVANASRKCASTLKPAEFAARASLRLFCNLDVPVREPGGYMLRAAVLDRQSGKTGSAYAFAPLPDYAAAGKRYINGQRRIMVSGMLLGLEETGASAEDGMQPAGSNPVEREFPPGSALAYSFEAYGGTTDRQTGVPMFTGTAIMLSPWSLEPVLDSGPLPIRADNSDSIAVRGKMAIKAGLGSGQYSLLMELRDEGPLSRSRRNDPHYGFEASLNASRTDFTIKAAR